MYLIHSRAIRTTPKALAEAFGVRRLMFPRRPGRAIPEALRLSRDFFCYYPDPACCVHTDELADYSTVREFASLDKYSQRDTLKHIGGLPVPATTMPSREVGPGEWLFRPLRHMKRIGFDRRTLDAPMIVPAGHYAAEWLNIAKEYRTLFVRGQPIATFKKNPLVERRWQLTTLDRLGLLDKLRGFKPLRLASMAGVDFAVTKDGKSFVLEVNFAPALCPKNIERVVAAFNSSTNQE